MTCSLRSSNIIFPLSTSCCANTTLDGNHFQKWYLWNQEVILQQWAETSWVLAGVVREASVGEPEGELVWKLGEKVVAVQPLHPPVSPLPVP